MKRILFFAVAVLFLVGCESDQNTTYEETQGTLDNAPANLKAKKGKVDICHYSVEDDSWHMINVNLNALAAHEGHGDVRLDDQDGDGYVPFNECGFGEMGDCDDTDPAVNPGAEEICGNGVDDDCDGLIDAEDEDCCQTPFPEELIGNWSRVFNQDPNDIFIMAIDDCAATVSIGNCKWSMDFLSGSDGIYSVYLNPLLSCDTNPNWTLSLSGTTLTVVNGNNLLFGVLEKQ